MDKKLALCQRAHPTSRAVDVFTPTKASNSHHGSADINPPRICEDAHSMPASFSRIRIRGCPELCCRSQMQLGSHIALAMAEACSCTSDMTSSLGTSTGSTCVPQRRKQLNQETPPPHTHLVLSHKEREDCVFSSLTSVLNHIKLKDAIVSLGSPIAISSKEPADLGSLCHFLLGWTKRHLWVSTSSSHPLKNCPLPVA